MATMPTHNQTSSKRFPNLEYPTRLRWLLTLSLLTMCGQLNLLYLCIRLIKLYTLVLTAIYFSKWFVGALNNDIDIFVVGIVRISRDF